MTYFFILKYSKSLHIICEKFSFLFAATLQNLNSFVFIIIWTIYYIYLSYIYLLIIIYISNYYLLLIIFIYLLAFN